VDNLCHTLAGVALARTGLGRRTALGTAALVIGANLPDLDALTVFLGGTTHLAFRRGWTHGVLAVGLWPFVLTALLLAWARWRRPHRADRPPVAPGALLLASAVGVLSHPLLDLLNTYGVRILMPFSGQWYYGDALFIVDVWAWLLLGAGILASGYRLRRARPHPGRPAVAALSLLVLYAALMRLGTRVAEHVAGETLIERYGEVPVSLLASPVPLDPTRRLIVAQVPEGYRTGEVRLGRRPAWRATREDPVPLGPWGSGVVHRAMDTREGRQFLEWARFPYVETERVSGATLVHFIDARYADRPGAGFGALTVSVPSQPPVFTARPRSGAAVRGGARGPRPPGGDPPGSGGSRRPG
jgi:inner membrane protein